MRLEYSSHWNWKKKFRPDITDDLIEYCISTSDILKDRKWADAFNAISRVPPSGRILKVVYKRKGKAIKILTCYWLD